MLMVFDRRPMMRDRLTVLASLLGVAAVAWIHLWRDAARMSSMSMAEAAVVQVWSAGWLLPVFVMWTIMMVAMMLPSAVPAILLYGSMARKNRERGSVLPSVWLFTAGYLAAWTAFGLVATLLQAALRGAALVSPMMASSSNLLNGGLLIVAGVYQWLPAKHACLDKCRDPLQSFLFRWRSGASGTFRMGLEHGAFCTGCCWALMLLLFTAGVMNLLWVALIAAYVLAEKLLPAPRWAGRIAGAVFIGTGGAMIA